MSRLNRIRFFIESQNAEIFAIGFFLGVIFTAAFNTLMGL